MMPAVPSTLMRSTAPKQERSRATLERICRAAAELLEEKSWAEVTVAEIVGRARSSVGSFYARFADKDALLDLLDERYSIRVLELSDQMAAWARAEEPDLDEYVHTLVRELVRFHRRSAGLIRALVLRARMYREPAYEERTKRMQSAVREVFGPLLVRVPRLGDTGPNDTGLGDPGLGDPGLGDTAQGDTERAGAGNGGTGTGTDPATVERCFFAFTFMFSALRDRILFPESIAAPSGLTDEALAEQLAAATLAYLRSPSMETNR